MLPLPKMVLWMVAALKTSSSSTIDICCCRLPPVKRPMRAAPGLSRPKMTFARPISSVPTPAFVMPQASPTSCVIDLVGES
jgi:hypothetical protein